MNKKLQNMLEEQLTKNMHLQKVIWPGREPLEMKRWVKATDRWIIRSGWSDQTTSPEGSFRPSAGTVEHVTWSRFYFNNTICVSLQDLELLSQELVRLSKESNPGGSAAGSEWDYRPDPSVHSLPSHFTTVHISGKVWAGLRLTPGTNIFFSPCIHQPAVGLDYHLELLYFHHLILPAGLGLNAGMSPRREMKGVRFKGEESSDQREWKNWAQLICVAIELDCTTQFCWVLAMTWTTHIVTDCKSLRVWLIPGIKCLLGPGYVLEYTPDWLILLVSVCSNSVVIWLFPDNFILNSWGSVYDLDCLRCN